MVRTSSPVSPTARQDTLIPVTRPREPHDPVALNLPPILCGEPFDNHIDQLIGDRVYPEYPHDRHGHAGVMIAGEVWKSMSATHSGMMSFPLYRSHFRAVCAAPVNWSVKIIYHDRTLIYPCQVTIYSVSSSGFLYARLGVYPLSGQTHLPKGEFEVTHGKAHVDPLHIGQVKEGRVSPAIAVRALHIEVPLCAVSDDAPGLFV